MRSDSEPIRLLGIQGSWCGWVGNRGLLDFNPFLTPFLRCERTFSDRTPGDVDFFTLRSVMVCGLPTVVVSKRTCRNEAARLQ